MQVKVDVAPVRHEDALARVCDTLLLHVEELLEERRHVEDHAGADQVDAALCHEAGGEEVEVVRDAVGLDRMAGIMTALENEKRQSPSSSVQD